MLLQEELEKKGKGMWKLLQLSWQLGFSGEDDWCGSDSEISRKVMEAKKKKKKRLGNIFFMLWLGCNLLNE